MTTWKFIIVAVVCIGFPLLWVLMWAKLAKNVEIDTAELLRYPSLRRYLKYDLAFGGLGMTGFALAFLAPHRALSWAGVLMLAAASVVEFRADKLRKAELRRLQESQGQLRE